MLISEVRVPQSIGSIFSKRSWSIIITNGERFWCYKTKASHRKGPYFQELRLSGLCFIPMAVLSFEDRYEEHCSSGFLNFKISSYLIYDSRYCIFLCT